MWRKMLRNKPCKALENSRALENHHDKNIGQWKTNLSQEKWE